MMSNRPRVLIAEPESFSKDAIATISPLADVELRAIHQSEMRQALSNYDAVWIRLHLQVLKRDLPSEMRCRYIVTATTGLDHVDVASLSRLGAACLSLRGHDEFLSSIKVTAEHAAGLLLALARNIPSAVNSVKDGSWDRDSFRGVELQGKTLGVIGFGRLGRTMAELMKAFGMRVLAYDPYVISSESKVTMVTDLSEMLSESDVVSLHSKLTEETEGLCDEGFFKSMKSTALLINTARGAILNENALLIALENGWIAGAALDVVCGEPDVDRSHKLVAYATEHSNLIITPHIGGCVPDIMARCELYLANVLCELLQGDRKQCH